MRTDIDVNSVRELIARGAAGEPVPTVDEALLRRAWAMFPATQEEGASANALDIVAAVGLVVFVRCAALNELLWSGDLAPWQHGARELDNFVFQEAATFPFSNELQHKEFVQRLQDKTSGN